MDWNQNLNTRLPNINEEELFPEEKKASNLERLLEIDLGLHMVVGALLLFVAFFAVAWRFDFIGHFQQREDDQTITSTRFSNSRTESRSGAIIAGDNDNPIFINSQIVEIEKAFKAEPSKIKLTISGQLKKEVFGFYPYWAMDKTKEIDIRLLTSISYFGLEVDGNGNIIKTGEDGKVLDAWAIWQNDKNFNELIKKAKRNKTKVYVTLKAFDRYNIEKLVSSPEAVKNFINNALYLMNSKSLDGINLDFEYIGTPTENTRNGFSVLVNELNQEMKRQYPKSLLTVCTFVDAAANTRLHDVGYLAQNSDGLVIMGYDFHTPNSSNAGPVAPMEGSSLSLVGLMSSYLEKAPADKLILAVPYYGYDWAVAKNEKNAEVVGGRDNVKVYPYAEIMEATKRTQINWDDNSQTPWYSYVDPQTRQTRVVHFEDARSLGIKYDYINQKNLQGVGIWALGFEGKRTDLLQLISDKFAH